MGNVTFPGNEGMDQRIPSKETIGDDGSEHQKVFSVVFQPIMGVPPLLAVVAGKKSKQGRLKLVRRRTDGEVGAARFQLPTVPFFPFFWGSGSCKSCYQATGQASQKICDCTSQSFDLMSPCDSKSKLEAQQQVSLQICPRIHTSPVVATLLF